MDEKMDETPAPPRPKARRKPAAKRAAGAGSSPAASAAPARRKPAPATKKPAARRRTVAPGGVEGLLRTFSQKASQAGASLAAASEGGVASARRAFGQAGAASKSTLDRLTREWKSMDPKRRAQYLAAILGALAAASAPIVRSRLKKR
ncbi:MAG: hypothetical protein ABI592_04250 [Acidobacteriota bacterium]